MMDGWRVDQPAWRYSDDSVAVGQCGDCCSTAVLSRRCALPAQIFTEYIMIEQACSQLQFFREGRAKEGGSCCLHYYAYCKMIDSVKTMFVRYFGGDKEQIWETAP